MITTMRECVLWPWPISSRSFGLDLENCVRSVASTNLDGLFLHLAQMITIISGCVACYIFSESENLNFWHFLENFRPWPWKQKSTVLDGFFPYLAQVITSMTGCVAYNDLWPWPISLRSFGLGLENSVRMWWPLTLSYIFFENRVLSKKFQFYIDNFRICHK